MAETYKTQCPYSVIVQSEPDHGIYDAMNKGLRMAKGDYLVFLNAGDTLHADDTLQTVANTAPLLSPQLGGSSNEQQLLSPQEGQRVGLLYGDTAIVDDEGRFLHLRRLRPPKQLSWKSFRQGMLVCHQAFYVRTDLARQQEYDLQYRYSADVDWCIRVMKQAEQQGLALVNTNTVLADFMEGGSTTQNHRASLKERYRVMCHHYGSVQTFFLHLWFVVRAIALK